MMQLTDHDAAWQMIWLAALPRLESLFLLGLPPRAQPFLSRLPLRVLGFHARESVDADAALEHLAACSSLVDLRMHGALHLTDAGLQRLAAMPQLERLDIGITGLYNASASFSAAGLVSLTGLSTLALSGCFGLTARTNGLLYALPHRPQLQELMIKVIACLLRCFR